MIVTLGTRHRWRFRPGWAATLATAVLLPLLLALGVWQLQRAAEKIGLRQQWTALAALPPVRLDVHDPARVGLAGQAGRRVVVEGRWQSERQILLDNQVSDDEVGYWVYTPLRVSAHAAILVNRGWVAAPPRRDMVPNVRLESGVAAVAGTVVPPPSPGPFAHQDVDASLGPDLLRVQEIDIGDLSHRLGLRLEPWILRLGPTEADGYRRRWPPPGGLTPERHQAYAVQWFALAALLIFLYVKLNLHRA